MAFTAGDKKRGEDAYYEDLTERGKRGGSGRGSRNKMKVEQYYEFSWDDEAFGLTRDSWLNYVGPYKNLKSKTEELPPNEIIGLPGRLKVVATAVITAAYIIELVGEKTRAVDGVRVIDEESLRIILEKIHQLSNRGEKQQADMLEEFLEDIREGKVSSEGDADGAYAHWKDERLQREVARFAAEWGADAVILMKALREFDGANPENIPRIDEIQDSVDLERATIKHGDMFFEHWLEMTEVMPGWMLEMRRGYWK